MKKSYDFIFNLGAACSSTQTLRANKLQIFSLPFDWLYGSNFERRINIFLSDFDRFINKEDLKDLKINNADKHNMYEIYYNSFNDITFNHDFPYQVPLAESYYEVREKYERRIARLLNYIKNSNKILIVYTETPNEINKLGNNEILISAMQRIKEKYPNKIFELLYFTQNSDLEFLQYKEEKVSDNIIKIIGNYKSVNPQEPDYQVNFDFFKNYYKNYSLNLPFGYKFKKILLKNIINLIPIKKTRKNLRKRYHV